MKLYHRTSHAAAYLIEATGTFTSKYPTGEVWFSTERDGQADGYGPAVVTVELPDHLLTIDDEFPSGEQHFTANVKDIKPQHIVKG